MSVDFRPVPENLKRVFLFTVRDLFPKDGELNAALRAGAGEIKGLPTFIIPLASLINGGRLDAVRPSGWRLFFLSPGQAIAADADVPDSGSPTISSISQGKQLASVLESVLAILGRPELQGGEQYELRLLRCSSVYIEACWLHSASGSQDIIVPIITGIEALKERQLYGLDQFFGPISETVAKLKEFGGN